MKGSQGGEGREAGKVGGGEGVREEITPSFKEEESQGGVESGEEGWWRRVGEGLFFWAAVVGMLVLVVLTPSLLRHLHPYPALTRLSPKQQLVPSVLHCHRPTPLIQYLYTPLTPLLMDFALLHMPEQHRMGYTIPFSHTHTLLPHPICPNTFF